jgi:hypothetical protein
LKKISLQEHHILSSREGIMSKHALFLKNHWNRVAPRALLTKIGQIFTVLIFVVSLLGGNTMNVKAAASASVAAAPAQVVLIEPEGNIGNVSDPTYTWNPAADAAYYKIGITDPDPATPDAYSTWLAAADVCDATVCSALHSEVLSTVTVVDGDYTWYVRGRDESGVSGPWSLSKVFTIESGASGLNTTITTKPLNPTTSHDATFEFTSNESLATFECKLGSESFAACDSPKTYTGLVDGSYTFEVRAVHGGETDSTPATHTWVISTAAVPAKPVLLEPQGNIGDESDPLYKWNPVAGAEYYKLGLADPTATSYRSEWLAASDVCNATVCSALHSEILPLVTVIDGGYTWYVQGRNASGTGLWSDSMSFTIESAVPAPNTTIDTHPANPSGSADASFEFTSTPAGATFECKLDSGAFAVCTSPKAYSGLSDDSHTFQVRAVNSGVSDPTPATYTWTIDTTAPETTITTHPANPSGSADVTFEFTSSESGSTFECKLDSGTFAACTSPKTYTGLGLGSHTFEVRASDAVGHVDATPASFTWQITEVYGPGTYDDGHAAWTYTGNWTAYTGSGPASDTMHYTNAQNASASITFSGTQFIVYFARYVNRGNVEVWIDGELAHTFSENGSLAWQSSWTLPAPLANGTHTVQFKNPSASTATYIDIDKITIAQ